MVCHIAKIDFVMIPSIAKINDITKIKSFPFIEKPIFKKNNMGASMINDSSAIVYRFIYSPLSS